MSLPLIIHHPIYRSAPAARRGATGNKYAALWRRLTAADMLGRVVAQPEPAPVWWLKLVHDADYVDAVLADELPEKMRRRIGLQLNPHFIERVRFSTAGTVLAGEQALQHGLALHSAGGSHHARGDSGAGYCVFNDVAVAARVLQARGLAQIFLVVDLDVHQGDGTAEIFRGDASVFTLSMHCEKNFPARKEISDLDLPLPKGTGDESYLRALEAHLGPLIDRLRPDLVFYNAGVDPHINDRLGHLNLSDNGLARRDAMVITACRERAVPLAAVLGGGYGEDPDEVAARHMLLFQSAVIAGAAD
jgi:acetoin utilization deacetylase AcuC-like enzyme